MTDVWRIDVRGAGEDLEHLLSADEVERAARFASVSARATFVTTRAALRTLAGSYLGVAPEAVAFSYGPQGKPEVEGLSFNVSHAGDVALAAFGSGEARRIGVDVELLRPEAPMRALARRFFTSAENEALEQLSGEELVRGFYGCWACKEAFVKAMGEGLSFGVGRVEVAVYPAPAGIVSVDGDEGAAAQWTLHEVDAGPGYAAAVAVDAPGEDVVVRDWPASVAA